MELTKRTLEMMKADKDPVYFAESPYFLNLKLFPKQAEILREFYNPAKNYTELVLIVGMRGGKTVLASVINAYELFKLLRFQDPAKHYGLIPGQDVFTICTAASETQAEDTIFGVSKALIRNSKFFQEENPKFYQLEVRFPDKHVTFLAGSSSSATLVGRSAKCVIFDELARFQETEGYRGAWNVYTSLSRSTKSFGKEGKIIAISSIRHEHDIMMELYKRAQSVPCILARKYATWEFNPLVTFESLEDERKKDPVSFWRDFGSEPSVGTHPFFDESLELFDSSLPNYLELLFNDIPIQSANYNYVVANDPAVVGTSYGIAIAHSEGDKIIVDGVWRFKPSSTTQISPIEVREFKWKILQSFNVTREVFDTYMYPELMEWLRLHGVRIEHHVVKKEDYDRVKELLYLKKLRIPYYQPLEEEFKQLQCLGSGKVDHIKGGSKDIADCVANAVWLLSSQTMRREPIVCHLL